MSFLTKFSLKNGAAIFIVALLLMGGGLYSFNGLKSELLPNIDLPNVTVTTIYPGASADDVDKKLTVPLENVLKGTESIEEIQSQSLESVSRIQMSFPFGADMEKLTQQIKDAVENVKLPEDAQTPTVNRLSFGAFPIVSLALFPQKSDQNVAKWVQETLKPDLEKIPGVSAAAISGVPQTFLEVTVDPAKASLNGVGLSSIKEAINGAFFSFPAGSVQENSIKVPIHIEQKITTLAQLQTLTVRSPLTNQAVRLADLAEIRAVEQRAEISRYNGKDSIALLITKKQDANTVQVAEDVYNILDKNKDKIQYATIFDQAEAVDSSIKELISKGLYGALFAALTVLLFLRNIRATLIAILSIPLSLLIAAIFIKWWGLTLNVMSLAGMTVAVGRVVDDSIIVIENIFRKILRNPNADRRELTLEGTREMLSAILSSTITTVVVFMPLGLVGGITGEIFLPFAVTVVVALLASFFVSITIVPVLARVSFNKAPKEPKEPYYVRLYERIIRSALAHKALTLFIAFLLLIGSGVLYAFGNVGFVFLPNEKVKIVAATIELPASTTLEKTNDVSLAIEGRLEEQKNRYPKRSISIGNFDFESGTTLPNRATYFIELAEGSDVPLEVKNIETVLKDVLEAQAPGATWAVREQGGGGPPSNNNVDIKLYSSDLSQLEKAALQVEQWMKQRSDLKQVTNNLQEKQQQWAVLLDGEKMKAANLSSFAVLGVIADRTRPVNAGIFNLEGVDQEVRLSYSKSLQGKAELESLLLFGPQGPKKLSDVARVEREDVYTSIQKLEGRIYAKISGQVIGNDIRAVSTAVTAGVKNLTLPQGVSLESGGGSDQTVQTFVDLGVAMAIAIGLVYLTMLVFFGKLRVPFIIMTSLLFVPIGALIGLILAREPLSLSAMIGLLMLIGIVVTNAIVMVDRINQNRSAGLTIRESLIESGKTRLRPILMTAIATIAALLPLVFSTPEGGIISRGLAVVVVGGLTTSTLLTVVFLPVVYELAFFRQHRQEKRNATSKPVAPKKK